MSCVEDDEIYYSTFAIPFSDWGATNGHSLTKLDASSDPFLIGSSVCPRTLLN